MKNIAYFIILVLVTGCGYTVRKTSGLPFRDINISSIINKTSEPNIEDVLYEKLGTEFLKQGIQVKASSKYILNGEINEFLLKVVSEKNEFSREYEVVIRADFSISGPDNFRKRYNAMQSPFIESFIAERSINSIISLKETATEQALESLADRLVTEVIYR
ncbi:hypothetical protein BMS3Abin07_00277 [bacterium BMS3Abin07]|nr:hypothetical protein BMS3Abin07_00277 [bacterium BMS3Abin07]GBE31817.1 hypothetical protein BMS3Bbin05_00720 [bacterium BMS3Bbin05]HDL19949.1 hypothetical protein [Nitrospirota bacterium]HDO21404.1 hypothetical protein [Nitrospirota bacterium]HDZ87465.1 hypothetical protein [Nitrospirota bacterium]